MKKFAFILAVLAFVLTGCQTTGSGVKTPTGESSNNSGIKDYHEVKPGTLKGTPTISDSCRAGNVAMCRSFADSMYKKGDFVSAIANYDMACQFPHNDIPSCVKMGFMFEKGEGVEKNLDNAGDIFKRACFHGHTPSCKDAKRLGMSW